MPFFGKNSYKVLRDHVNEINNKPLYSITALSSQLRRLTVYLLYYKDRFLKFTLQRYVFLFTYANFFVIFFVILSGLEPKLTEPKSAVLPLHNGTILSSTTVSLFDGANVDVFLISTKENEENFKRNYYFRPAIKQHFV